MTDPEARALQLLADILGATPVEAIIRAKCPGCRRWCIRDRWALAERCYLCRDIGEPYTFMDLLLMGEYGLTWNAYQLRLERYGPPWVNPREWVHSRKRQTEWQRAHGGARLRDDGGEGGGT